jgi:hypothetical protein
MKSAKIYRTRRMNVENPLKRIVGIPGSAVAIAGA